MAEGLATAEGTVLQVPAAGDVEQEWATAMAAPEPGEEPGAPPKKAPPADPEAPYGRTKDGTPKKGPGGRPARKDKTEAPRIQPAAAAAPGSAEDFEPALGEVADRLWLL